MELLESLLFVLGVLLDHLLARAAARVLALASITLTCTLEDGTSYTRTVRPALPSNDKRLWLKLLHLDLEAHSCAPSRERDGDPEPQAAIVAVTMQGEPGKLGQTQLGLFSPQLPEGARLEVTLARIRALVGEGNVGRAALQDTHAAGEFSSRAVYRVVEPASHCGWKLSRPAAHRAAAAAPAGGFFCDGA